MKKMGTICLFVVFWLGVTSPFHSQAATLTLVSGSCEASVTVDLAVGGSNDTDSGPYFAKAQATAALASASGRASVGPSESYLWVYASNGSEFTGFGFPRASGNASFGSTYIVTSTPGDTGTTGLISFFWGVGGGEVTGSPAYGTAYVNSPEVRLNNQTVVDTNLINLSGLGSQGDGEYHGRNTVGFTYSGSGTFEASLGDSISVSCWAWAEPAWGGGYGEGYEAFLYLDLSSGNFTSNPVPLPPTLLLLGSGLLGLAGLRRFRKS